SRQGARTAGAGTARRAAGRSVANSDIPAGALHTPPRDRGTFRRWLRRVVRRLRSLRCPAAGADLLEGCSPPPARRHAAVGRPYSAIGPQHEPGLQDTPGASRPLLRRESVEPGLALADEPGPDPASFRGAAPGGGAVLRGARSVAGFRAPLAHR